MLGTPSTDPDVRHYRIRLLPQVMTPNRRKDYKWLQNKTTYPLQRMLHACPTLCSGHGLLSRVPLGWPPFLHSLRTCRARFVRELLRSYWAIRLPLSVHRRRTSLDFPTRPFCQKGEQGISRFPCRLFPRMHGVSDRAGSVQDSPYRLAQCGLPLLLTTSAPRRYLSRLNTQPALSPVNASPRPRGSSRHDSGSLW